MIMCTYVCKLSGSLGITYIRTTKHPARNDPLVSEDIYGCRYYLRHEFTFEEWRLHQFQSQCATEKGWCRHCVLTATTNCYSWCAYLPMSCELRVLLVNDRTLCALSQHSQRLYVATIFLLTLQFVLDEGGEKSWTVYDAGPKSVRCPIVCLPPASGRADVFFNQILSLSSSGYRVISVSFKRLFSVYRVYMSFEYCCVYCTLLFR